MNLKDILYRVTHWETWHHHVKYIPLTPVWIWYCIRSGTPWFFTPSNPTLTFGGFEGEGKKEMYEQLPPGSYPQTIYIAAGIPFEDVVKQVMEAEFQYPFIVKPNVGMMGFMVRKISNAEQLKKYHQSLPIDYIVQTLVDFPIEVAAFYYRMPNEKKGTLSGLLKKQPAFVTGDGKSTLQELINANEQVRFKLEDIISRNSEQLKQVISNGTNYNLSVTSNRSQAGIIEGIDHEINAKLTDLLDDWSLYSGNFFYGRYDIKCASVEALKDGKDFYILEFNGAGAGIQHIIGNNYSLFKAIKIILHHWKMLFKISRLNYKRGIKYWGFKAGGRHLKEAKKNLMMLEKLDADFPSFP